MNPESAALLRKARSSLEAARHLLAAAYFDFAASRAYYAMFYAAEALLLVDSLSFSKRSAVIAGFGKQFAKTGRVETSFPRDLIDAEARRNVGDYDTGPGLERADADAQLERAGRFLAMAEEFLGRPKA